MFGLINTKEERYGPGGEIHKDRIRKQKIAFGILGVIALIILNIILYFMTKV
jgi:hypothetical protein